MRPLFVINLVLILTMLFLSACVAETKKDDKIIAEESNKKSQDSSVFLMILGNAQDGGSPHIGCEKKCCADLFESPDPIRKVVSLGLIDRIDKKKYIFEASPDFTSQIKHLKSALPAVNTEMPDGIFLTHAHIGHYTGLMYLGKEARNADKVPVYSMPRMNTFLRKNGPWSQLVQLENIVLQEMTTARSVQLSSKIKVQPFTVPHRDEYSETVGFIITGPNKSALFIPDIDKWEKWEEDIISAIKKVDYAFLDATFFDKKEINNRDISQIPHPFVIESMEKFKELSASEKAKIHFIHFNHTNPLLRTESNQSKEVLKNGFNISRFNQRFSL